MTYGAGLVLLAAAPIAWSARPSAPTPPAVTVYKDPNCGCCRQWVTHMASNGFRVDTVNVASSDALTVIKRDHGVTARLASCHTALVGGYVIEGHVPADLVLRVLRERPDIAGLAVPGMVAGSPGMESPAPQHYTVLAFKKDGSTTVYASR